MNDSDPQRLRPHTFHVVDHYKGLLRLWKAVKRDSRLAQNDRLTGERTGDRWRGAIERYPHYRQPFRFIGMDQSKPTRAIAAVGRIRPEAEIQISPQEIKGRIQTDEAV